MYRKWIKGLIDKLLVCLLLVITLPLFLVIIGLLLITQGRPFFFSQKRSGIHGRFFLMYKFRTLKKRNTGGSYHIDPKDFTPLGKFLRRTSLDELPQLVNVLKGDMTFVGPRPLPPEYLGRMNIKYRRRYSVKPGITGLAQIRGRNGLTWQEKFDFDLEYVCHQSFVLDMLILIRTIPYAIFGYGVNAAGIEGMPEFKG